MSIGIYDADIAKYVLLPFNITAMKLSAYYKKKRELVVLAKEFDPLRNKTFFFIKDWNDGDFPSDLKAPNVTYYGHAFSGPQYSPLPEDIELCKPDTSIYSIMEPIIKENSTQTTQKIWSNMINGEHCRISLDGKTVWPQYHKQFLNLAKTRDIMFHDYDLNRIEGGWETVQEILSHCRTDYFATRIGTKFPICVDNSSDFLKWTSLRTNSIFYSMQYNGVIDYDTFAKWLGRADERQVYPLVDYRVTNNFKSEADFLSRLNELYYEIVLSRSYRVKISLKYEDDFFSNPMWCKVLDLFNFYQHSMMGFSEESFIRDVQTDTLYDFARKAYLSGKKYPYMQTRDEMRHVFNFVGEHNPQLFKDFYELNYLKLKEATK